MANRQRKEVRERQNTAANFSRITFGNRESSRKTITRSQSFTSVCSSTSMLSSLSEESKGISPLEKKVEEYEEEWCLYMLRVAQCQMLRRKEKEKQGSMRKCLVSLKKEYEEVLAENGSIYEKLRKMEMLERCHRQLAENLPKARKLLEFLKQSNLGETFNGIAANLEQNANRLRLVGLTRKEIDEAFEKNILGFDSDIYEVLNIMEDNVADRQILVPEIVEILKEIRLIHAGNEKLKIRCTALADQLRRETIASDYEKYFAMAVDECKDILEKLPLNRVGNDFADESLPQTTLDWAEPTSSSTPAAICDQ